MQARPLSLSCWSALGRKKIQASQKKETFMIHGKEGTLVITPTFYELLGPDGALIKQVVPQFEKIDVLQRMFDAAFSKDATSIEAQFDRQIVVIEQILTAYGK